MTHAGSALGSRRAPPWLMPILWVILTVGLIAAGRALPWQLAVEQVKRIQVPWLVAAIAANAVILPLWASEWRLLTPVRVAYARMFDVVAVTAAVLNTVPFFAGEASAVALLIGHASLSRGAALSVLAMDQLLVGLAKLAVLAAAALYAPLPAWLRAGILSLVVLVALLLAVLVPLAHQWERVHALLLTKTSTARSALARVVSWGAHLGAVRDPRVVWRVTLLALTKRAAELLGIIAVQVAFGVEPSVASALLVLAALAVTTMIPVAPANLGVYEATVFATYRYLGVPPAMALGLAVIQHLCFLIPPLATGYLTLTLRQLQPRGARAS